MVSVKNCRPAGCCRSGEVASVGWAVLRLPTLAGRSHRVYVPSRPRPCSVAGLGRHSTRESRARCKICPEECVMEKTRKTTKADVCILESLRFFDEQDRREGEIISRTLRMLGKELYYVYIRSRQELEQIVTEYARSSYRYLHLSCHGKEEGFRTTLDFINADESAKIFSVVKGKRRLFLSSCSSCTTAFGKSLIEDEDSEWLSVVGPDGKINFDDAAIFWATFYHRMFNENDDGMSNSAIEANIALCSAIIDQDFRFVRKERGTTIAKVVPHLKFRDSSKVS